MGTVGGEGERIKGGDRDLVRCRGMFRRGEEEEECEMGRLHVDCQNVYV